MKARRAAIAAELCEKRRQWYAANKDRHKEWRMRRKQMTCGRALPRGTIKRIGAGQRWRCAICRTDIRNKYHVDHVVPLAKGGEHHPLNIQLLCPTCNTRKSDKDPIEFMQSQGFLL